MVEFLVKHKLINTSQHGFLKARSCLTNLFLEEITKWVDDGSPVDVVYLDFQKAFDKVTHQRLLLTFADDTRVFRKVTNDTDKQSLQDDLYKLVKWSEKWKMLLNFRKCKCIHIGHGNMDEEYKMGDAALGRTTQEKDLGVTFSADMKVSEQCGIAASKGNQILGLIRRTVTYKEKQPLYKAIVRPHLEYCIQAWWPYRKKDIDKLERIQRRATKMIPELRDLSMKAAYYNVV